MAIFGGVRADWVGCGGDGKSDRDGLELALDGGDIAVLACRGLGAGLRWDLYQRKGVGSALVFMGTLWAPRPLQYLAQSHGRTGYQADPGGGQRCVVDAVFNVYVPRVPNWNS